MRESRVRDGGELLLEGNRAGQRLEDAVDDVAVDHFAANRALAGQ